MKSNSILDTLRSGLKTLAERRLIGFVDLLLVAGIPFLLSAILPKFFELGAYIMVLSIIIGLLLEFSFVTSVSDYHGGVCGK